MDTAESRIARVLGVNEAESRVFIQRVRALVGTSPCDAWIACCLEMLPGPSSPEAVARKIEEMGLIARPGKRSTVPEPKKAGRPSGETRPGDQPQAKGGAEGRPARDTKSVNQPRTPGGTTGQPSSQRAGSRPSRPRWKPWNDPRDAEPDPFDPSRVPLGNLYTCPHGVPQTGVCRICSPERFEMLGDPD
jgi:hypothetical protein